MTLKSIFSKIIKNVSIFFHKLHYYGFPVAFYNLLDSQRKRIKIFSVQINVNKHKAINAWLLKNFDYLIPEYAEKREFSAAQTAIPRQIWICWWDGIEFMPPIVKACYRSVLKHKNDFEVTVITKNNFANYVSIPEHIINKFNSGIITVTHLSDVIRMLLLEKYGGLWLDASILVTNDIILNDKSFFTIRGDSRDENVAVQRWAGNCIGGMPGAILFSFICHFFSEYWKKFNDMIDYFLIDYAIDFAYTSFPGIKEMIDSICLEDKFSNANYMFLQKQLRKEFNAGVYNVAAKSSVFHKLAWKENFQIHTPDSKLTFYGHILQQYSN